MRQNPGTNTPVPFWYGGSDGMVGPHEWLAEPSAREGPQEGERFPRSEAWIRQTQRIALLEPEIGEELDRLRVGFNQQRYVADGFRRVGALLDARSGGVVEPGGASHAFPLFDRGSAMPEKE